LAQATGPSRSLHPRHDNLEMASLGMGLSVEDRQVTPIQPMTGSFHSTNEAISFVLNHREGDGEVKIDDDADEEEGPEDMDAPLKFRFSWRKLWR